jgi:hypothetical protein
MRKMTLKQVFEEPLAWGELCWRFLCALTEENVAEAVALYKQYCVSYHPQGWQELLDNVEGYSKWTDEQWSKMRTLRMGSWIIRTEEQLKEHQRRMAEEDAQTSQGMRRGVGLLKKYIEENNNARL